MDGGERSDTMERRSPSRLSQTSGRSRSSHSRGHSRDQVFKSFEKTAILFADDLKKNRSAVRDFYDHILRKLESAEHVDTERTAFDAFMGIIRAYDKAARDTLQSIETLREANKKLSQQKREAFAQVIVLQQEVARINETLRIYQDTAQNTEEGARRVYGDLLRNQFKWGAGAGLAGAALGGLAGYAAARPSGSRKSQTTTAEQRKRQLRNVRTRKKTLRGKKNKPRKRPRPTQRKT